MKICAFLLFFSLQYIAALNSATLSNALDSLLIQMDKTSKITVMACWNVGVSYQLIKNFNSFGYFVKITEPSIINFPNGNEHQNVIIVDLNCEETNKLFIEVLEIILSNQFIILNVHFNLKAGNRLYLRNRWIILDSRSNEVFNF